MFTAVISTFSHLKCRITWKTPTSDKGFIVLMVLWFISVTGFQAKGKIRKILEFSKHVLEKILGS